MKMPYFNVLQQICRILNVSQQKEKEERERGKRKRKEKEERERGKRKRKVCEPFVCLFDCFCWGYVCLFVLYLKEIRDQWGRALTG